MEEKLELNKKFTFETYVYWLVGLIILFAFSLFVRATIICSWCKNKLRRNHETKTNRS